MNKRNAIQFKGGERAARSELKGEGAKHTNTILLNQVLGLSFGGRHSGGGRAGKGAEQTGEDGSDGDGFTLVVKGKEVLL